MRKDRLDGVGLSALLAVALLLAFGCSPRVLCGTGLALMRHFW